VETEAQKRARELFKNLGLVTGSNESFQFDDDDVLQEQLRTVQDHASSWKYPNLKTGRIYSASDAEKKWHVEPIFISLRKYLKGKAPGSKLAKEVYRSAYNQGVTIHTDEIDLVKSYPKAWLDLYFGNLDELSKFLK